MTIYKQLKTVLEPYKNQIVFSSEVKQLLSQQFGTNPDSVMLSDYCYNRINKEITFKRHLFEYITKGSYKYL